MSRKAILIIDDEPDIRELLGITLHKMGLDTHAAATVNEARHLLTSQTIHLCLTDMRLPDGDGLDLVDHIQQQYPHIPVAVITAHGNMDLAIRALKSGAFDFISKPLDLTPLRKLVVQALQLPHTIPPTTDKERGSANNLQGHSVAIQHLKATIDKLARTQAPVYIHGESGTGKERVARLIHSQSGRRDAPFIAVNCSAIPRDLLESEFFGHKKGSFSGAHSNRPGLFQAANQGTLFLDEIADLPLDMQVKLLRAIQEKAVRPVGASQEESIDLRILSASHHNLDTLVKENRFRQDLYYRINVIQLDVPSLRQRLEDIDELATTILNNIAQRDEHPPLTLSEAAIAKLKTYPFPGNIRELENILERATALCNNHLVDATDLHLPKTKTATEAAPPPDHLPDTTTDNLDDQLANRERTQIEAALSASRWNQTQAAKRLGLSLRQLRYRIKKLGIG